MRQSVERVPRLRPNDRQRHAAVEASPTERPSLAEGRWRNRPIYWKANRYLLNSGFDPCMLKNETLEQRESDCESEALTRDLDYQ